MNKITKAWTYGVAYLSLAVGSGVSISGNIADTYRVAGSVGRTPDGLDIAISAFWPAAVLLAIEMFVSRLWPRTAPMQAVRWLGSLGIGFVAMYVSWHHLADLLTNRGQDGIVAGLGPLAIDGLAIMATGLILSSRGHKIVDTVATPRPAGLANLFTPPPVPYLATSDTAAATVHLDNSTATYTPADNPVATYATVADEAMSYLDSLATRIGDVDSTPAVPVSGPPALSRSNEVKPDSVPTGAVMAFQAWLMLESDESRLTPGARNEFIAEAYNVSVRTARRWFTAYAAA